MRKLVVAAVFAWATFAAADAPLAPPSRVAQWSPNRRYVAVVDPKRDDVAVYRADGVERVEL
jgi:6-phosphogluconolactonase (cycloisomerase 2 family)